MSYTLVIVESPAKCKKIESYLGPGYKVIASFGHLRNIKDLNDIDIENGFIPKYSIINDNYKLKQIEKLRSSITNANNVIIATDDDREGEAIGWHICDLFGLSISSTKRIIFHEITENAIKKAIINPKSINMNLVNAQQCRAVLDMLVGFIISPILWKNISTKHEKGLSAGRCQTPALRLIYDNYLDIQKSPGLLVYNINGYFTNLHLNYELNKQLASQDEIDSFYELCKNYDFICNNSVPKKVIKQPPEPFTTSRLQQVASNILHLSPKDTMKYAQELYENGFITYMRTDNNKYSNDFVSNAKKYIETNYGEKYINNNLSFSKTDSQKQEAHEAIRPISLQVLKSQLESESLLTPKSIKLYELIWKNTIQSCMSSAQFNSITSKITFNEQCVPYIFSYKAEQIIFPGWLTLEKENNTSLQNNIYNYLSNLKKNIKIKPTKINISFTLINLKSHYTEARLVQLLEEKGIGRPSTFAMLVDKIQERGYVEKQNITGKSIIDNDYIIEYEGNNLIINKVESKKEFGNEKSKLVIQPLGIIVIEYLINNFDEFFDYEYTKYMETMLDNITSSNEIREWSSICSECYDKLKDITKELGTNKFSIELDKYHSIIIGKYGPVIKKKSDNGDITFIKVKKDFDIKKIQEYKLEDIIEINESERNNKLIGKYKGYDLYLKKGKYGLYVSWSNEKVSLKELDSKPFELITYEEILIILEKDKILDPSKPIGLIRELTNNLSIRTGKYGDYIFYKKANSKKPLFLKLNGFNDDYKKCNKDLLVNWINQTYKLT
jgi:DNA topoisomerase I